MLDAKELSSKARRTIADYGNQVFVSSATAWEITTKFRIGRLPQAEAFVHSLRGNLARLGFSELPISVDHAQRAGMLSGGHKDPFDRMLIAQAQAEGLVLVTNENLFDAYHVHRIW